MVRPNGDTEPGAAQGEHHCGVEWMAVIDYRAVQSLRLRELPVPSPVGLVGARERRTGGVVVGLSGEPPLMTAIPRDGTRDPSLARASPEG